jgi:uncharacterized protein (DUF1697 family)
VAVGGARGGEAGRVSAAQIALLRGINVGRAKRIAMADLRKLVEGLGYDNVRTLLNSGNMVFARGAGPAADPATRIQKAIAAELGVVARVIVIDAKTLAAALAANPLAGLAHDPSRLLVAVAEDGAALRKLAALAAQDWHPEVLARGRGVAWLWCPGGIAASKLVLAANRALGDGVTMRNVATMSKLLALALATQ